MSMGVAKRDGKFLVALVVEKEDSWALEKANELRRQHQGGVTVHVIGKAYWARPGDAREQQAVDVLEPGISIGHAEGYPGSLGCFVAARSKGKTFAALTSASHVLALFNEAQKGDPVIHPGHPDGPRTLENRIGTLANYSYLVHHQEKGAYKGPLNAEDIALVLPSEQQRMPEATFVPNPKSGAKKLKLKKCIEPDQLFERIAEPVYKIGRTTDFTEGVVEVARLAEYPIQQADGRIYLYKDLVVVKNKGKKEFGQPGDSGSIAYTSDGLAVGVVVGGSPGYTFLSPLATSLRAMNAELLT
jgi:hypothetical protein